MKFEIKQLLCSLKCVIMLQQNHLYSQSLVQRLFLFHLPTPLMTLPWMLRPEASGVGARTHILMLGYFTQMLPCSYLSLISLTSVYKRLEDAKKREYGHRVGDIEHGAFTPLVFTSTGGMGRETTVFYRPAFSCTCHPLGTTIYSQTINWLRCRLSFALLRCTILCIHGSMQVFCPASCAPATGLISGPELRAGLLSN